MRFITEDSKYKLIFVKNKEKNKTRERQRDKEKEFQDCMFSAQTDQQRSESEKLTGITATGKSLQTGPEC